MAPDAGDDKEPFGRESQTETESFDLNADPTIEDLAPATFQAVATRLANSASFTELISRECELDALWTLCDIALDYTSIGSATVHSGGALQSRNRETLTMLRTLIGEAITALGGSDHDSATRLVHEAAELAGALQ
jgi:hypothetical protein